ncbi:MAG: DNA internalization-related competence protein ComEC/Rec2 [Bacteroidota bacterium]|nr:DNA internalization-related competence protein ComEC/Rec2 [Bacteroidota bacterium]
MIGIIVGWYISFSISIVIIGMLGILLLYFVVRLLIIKSVNSSTILFLIMIFSFGILKIEYDTKHFPDQTRKYQSSPSLNDVLVRGTITDRAVIKRDRVTFIIEAESIRIGSVSYVMEGGIVASIRRSEISDETISNLEYGKVVWLNGDLQSLQGPRNPHEFDYRQYLLLNDIYSRLFIQCEEDISIGDRSGNWLLSNFVYPVREWIGKLFDSIIGGEEAKIMKGLVIGERSEMTPEVKTAFINSGLMHILAVSGFNVGLVTVIFWTIFSIFRLSDKVRAVLTGIALIWFMYLTGAQPPVARAVIMAIIIIGARAMELKSDLYNTVAVAAMIFLLVDAKGLFDVGFQLSFAAVLSLAYLYPKITSLSNRLLEQYQNNLIVKYLTASVAVSLAATIGTLPLTAYYFNKIPIIGIGLNLVAVPLSGIILALGFTVSAATAISIWLGSLFAEVASLLSTFLLKLTTWGGNLSFAFIETHINLPLVIGLYGGILSIFEFNRKAVRKWTLILSLVIINIIIYESIFREGPKILRVTFLDVGQGDAIYLEFPDGRTMIVDAGPKTFSTDAGTRFLVPFLKSKGIKKLDALLVTHPDADHLGGVPTILRNIKVDEVFESGIPCQSSLCEEYYHLIDSLEIERFIISGGVRIEDSNDIRIYVLHPTGEFIPEKTKTSLGSNNQSLVLKVVYGKTSILLTGDTEWEAESFMVRAFGDFLKSNVLKVAHHGSNSGTSAAYLKTIQPIKAVISVGAKNRYNHPSPEVLQRIRDVGSEYYRTDESGAVVLESNGEKWWVVDWR